MWAKLQRSWPDNQELPDDLLHPGNELLSLVHEIVARIGSLNVYVMKVDGSNKTRLTSDPARDGWPDWSPDASLIVFSSERDGEREIYTMRRNGSDQKRLTNSDAEYKRLQTKYCNTDPAWAPDGRWIAFNSERDGNSEIYIMRLGALAHTPLG